jgi:hypothetical protein
LAKQLKQLTDFLGSKSSVQVALLSDNPDLISFLPYVELTNFISRVLSWQNTVMTGFGLVNGFIDHLYTRLGTTHNYSAITNLHKSPQHPLSPFQPTVSSPAIPCNSFSQCRFFSFTLSSSIFTACHAELNSTNNSLSTEL